MESTIYSYLDKSYICCRIYTCWPTLWCPFWNVSTFSYVNR